MSTMSTLLPNGDALMKLGDMAMKLDPSEPAGGHSGRGGMLPKVLGPAPVSSTRPIADAFI